ncbi:peptide chain release factor N(5)-glutamine methyltransferase [Sporosarcina sp. G11-34]|uniref:peptide chain release factor N(5)-glutamine methyltransferase n=1 Tax=Sporosarcina sp. G11-34 TaxID=2849605 RepID=UPI0022A93592|nr:peptide chain release factor N(5)-glutamine methyltransferase [Sporosarcina sp. G11-34]MCZ2257525.1 peptide chain release factor N(5)-glutamine methyltransferase [Sporosarcina sp. G11-34]
MTEPIYIALNKAASLLNEKGLDTGAARILMEFITEKTSASLLADIREELTKEQQTKFWSKVEEVLAGRPVQYVTGVESFYGRLFEVNEHVLIPRPETEELIYGAIERCEALFPNESLKFADIGTGSGAIAITFKKECPEADVTATDISTEALSVAKRNAELLGVDIEFLEGDMAVPLSEEKWDVILSNPPYIAHEEAIEMSDTVLSHEPHSALFAEEDGLYFYRKLAESLPPLMKKPALIGVEIGHMQGSAVHKLFADAFPTAIVETIQDINGKDRIIFCKISE